MSYDRYVYPGTNVLKNLAGFDQSPQAEAFERKMSSVRLLELEGKGVTGAFDAGHLRSIHHDIFQDVYDWAGEYRDLQIWKGGTEFSSPDRIGSDLDALCSGIKAHNYFLGQGQDDIANALADTMARLNLIHPFREGNGRTQRAFIGQLAMNAGYDLDFKKISETDMRDASMAANRGQPRLMQYLFRSSISPIEYTGPTVGSVDMGRGAVADMPKRTNLLARLFGKSKSVADGRAQDGPEGP